MKLFLDGKKGYTCKDTRVFVYPCPICNNSFQTSVPKLKDHMALCNDSKKKIGIEVKKSEVVYNIDNFKSELKFLKNENSDVEMASYDANLSPYSSNLNNFERDSMIFK